MCACMYPQAWFLLICIPLECPVWNRATWVMGVKDIKCCDSGPRSQTNNNLRSPWIQTCVRNEYLCACCSPIFYAFISLIRAAAAAEEASQLRDMLSVVINKAVLVAIEQEQGSMMDQLEHLANGLEDINVALKEGTQVRGGRGRGAVVWFDRRCAYPFHGASEGGFTSWCSPPTPALVLQMKEFEHKIATTLQSMHGNHAKKMVEWDTKLSSIQVQVGTNLQQRHGLEAACRRFLGPTINPHLLIRSAKWRSRSGA